MLSGGPKSHFRGHSHLCTLLMIILVSTVLSCNASDSRKKDADAVLSRDRTESNNVSKTSGDEVRNMSEVIRVLGDMEKEVENKKIQLIQERTALVAKKDKFEQLKSKVVDKDDRDQLEALLRDAETSIFKIDKRLTFLQNHKSVFGDLKARCADGKIGRKELARQIEQIEKSEDYPQNILILLKE